MLHNIKTYEMQIHKSKASKAFANFNVTHFTNWKSIVLNDERNKSQILKTNNHQNQNYHNNVVSSHSNTNITNEPAYHTNNVQPKYAHTNNVTSDYDHTDKDYDYTTHTNNKTEDYDHTDYDYSVSKHSNSTTSDYDHTDYDYSTSKHSNYTTSDYDHTDYDYSVSSHTNYDYVSSSHKNYSYYAKKYNHVNYETYGYTSYWSGTTYYNHTNYQTSYYSQAHANYLNTSLEHRDYSTSTPKYSQHGDTTYDHTDYDYTVPKYSQHGDTSYDHTDYDYSSPRHSNHGDTSYDHSNSKRDRTNHSNHGDTSYDHTNSTVNDGTTGYSQYFNHNNVASTTYTPHVDTTTHNDVGFDHQNYVPSTPRFYDVDTFIKDTVTIGFVSYDQNKDGDGTQTTQAKTVKYKLEIRQIENLDGSSNVGSWQTLYNFGTADTFDLDTTQFNEGKYQLKATAKNDAISQNGDSETYVSSTETITTTIRQNSDIELSVTNGNEFIGFTFGEAKATDGANYKTYGELYSSAPSLNEQGLFISVQSKDLDTDQYQKGQAHLKDAQGNVIATKDITWSNGSSIIGTNGSTNTGYIYFEKESFLDKTQNGLNVEVNVKDYLDASATQEAGSSVTRTDISNTNSTDLVLDVEVTKPTLNITYDKTPSNEDITIHVVGADASGIERIQTPDGWINNSVVSYVATSNGDYTFTAEDKLGNTFTKTVTVDNIDRVDPTATVSFESNPTNENVMINVNATDDNTGVKIKRPDNLTVDNSTSYEVTHNGTYEFIVTDSAGNSITKLVEVTNIDKEAPTLTITHDISPSNTDLGLNVIVSDNVAVEKVIMPDGTETTDLISNYSVSSNGTYEFKVIDTAGNETIKSVTVTNIDKVDPTGSITYDETKTNEDVELTFIASDDVAIDFITLPNGDTVENQTTAKYTVGENGDYTFTVTDTAGNEIAKTVNVTNIDKTAPAKPNVNIVDDKDNYKKYFEIDDSNITASDYTHSEVSINGGEWKEYTEKLLVPEGSTVYSVRSVDDVGNTSTPLVTVISINYNNWDETAPELMLTASIINPTNADVIITAEATDDFSGVKSIELPDGTIVNDTEAEFTATINGTYTFKVLDNSDNETVQSINITNIDKVNPSAPMINIENYDTLVLTDYSDVGFGVLNAQYQIDDGGWTNYSEGILLDVGDYNIKTRTIDVVGNISVINEKNITIYDKRKLRNVINLAEHYVIRMEAFETYYYESRANYYLAMLPDYLQEKIDLEARLDKKVKDLDYKHDKQNIIKAKRYIMLIESYDLDKYIKKLENTLAKINIENQEVKEIKERLQAYKVKNNIN